MSNAPAQDQAAIESGTVLIVDDELLIAAFLEDILVGLGYRTCGTAGSAVEAISLARDRRPAVAFVDIGLRGPTDGVSLARRLVDDFGVAVIFLSGSADEATRRAADAVQPLAFLTKPFTEDEIAAVMRLTAVAAGSGLPTTQK